MKHTIFKIVSLMGLLFMLGFTTLGSLLAQPPAQAACPGSLPARLIVGEGGRVAPGSANNLRDQASTAGARLLQIPGGGGFIVLEGPLCADGYTWWRVNYNGLIGWTVEGSSGEYWLEPTGPLPTQAPTLTPPPVFTPTEVGAVSCPGFLASRLVVGEQGRVMPGPANNVRSEPRTDSQLVAEMPGGASFVVQEGPLCLGGMAWWRVNFRGVSGWTVEGRNTEYWLEPAGPLPTQAPTLTPTITLTPRPTSTPRPTETPAPVLLPVQFFTGTDHLLFAPLPANRERITAENIERLRPVSLVGGGGVSKIALSPDGKTIAVLNSLGVWLNDVTSPAMPGLFLETPGIQVDSIAFSPDSALVALGGLGYPGNSASTLQLWDVRLGTPFDVFQDVRISISLITFSPDGRLLATAGQDGIVRLWNVEDGRLLHELDERKGMTTVGLTFSPDGTLLAFSNNYGYIRIWNVTRQQHQIEYQVLGGGVNDVLFSPDSALLLASGWGAVSGGPTEGLLRVWDIATGRRLESVHFPHTVDHLALSPDQTTVAVSGFTWGWLVDMASRTITTSWEIPIANQGLAFTADNTHLLIGHHDGTVRLWDTAGRDNEVLLDYGTLQAYEIAAISPDGGLLALVPGGRRTIRIWDTVQRAEVHTLSDFNGDVAQVNFVTNDLLRFNVQATHTQYTWNLSTGDYTTDAIQTTPVPYSSVLSDLAYSLIPYTQSARRQVTSTAQMPDSSILAFTDGISVQFWDMDTRLPLGQIRFFGIVKGFNDDHTVMVTHSNGVIWLWAISP